MGNTIKFKAMLRIAGIIVLAAVIGFSMTACGDKDDDGGGSDKRSTLNGSWAKNGATDNEKFEYIHNKYNPQAYFRVGVAGGAAIYGDLKSYDGTTATIDPFDGSNIVFTAKVSGTTLTISGLEPFDAGPFFGGIIDFNGTYTKK